MLYRKAPRRPATLLLRIVATASAGAVVGACGGATTQDLTHGVEGTVGIQTPAGGGDGSVPGAQQDGSDGGSVEVVGGGTRCLGLCGFTVDLDAEPAPPQEDSGIDRKRQPADGAVADAEPSTDGASSDEGTPDLLDACGGVCGVVIHPDGGEHEAGGGLVVGTVPYPDGGHVILGVVAHPGDGGESPEAAPEPVLLGLVAPPKNDTGA